MEEPCLSMPLRRVPRSAPNPRGTRNQNMFEGRPRELKAMAERASAGSGQAAMHFAVLELET